MKSRITADFLRGILFAFLIWQAYYYLFKEALIGIYPIFQSAQFFPTFILGIAYLTMGICLFLFPKKTSKGIFIFFALFCSLPFLMFFAFIYHPGSGSSFLTSPKFFGVLFPYIFWATVAYFHAQLVQASNQAQQGAAANP
jgi:hypothetical protein